MSRKKKSVPNPDYTPRWSVEAQNKFMVWAYEYYTGMYGHPATDRYSLTVKWYADPNNTVQFIPPKPRKETLSWLYKLGRDTCKLNCSYQQFANGILHRVAPYPNYYGTYHRRIKYYWRGYKYDESKPYTYYWIAEYRQKVGYQKKEHHSKKEISEKELNRSEWRERKGFAKD